MKLTIKNLKGDAQGELDVTFPVIEDGKGNQAVHDYVVAYQAARRSGTACTKNVGDVNGTNKKPWRQKGTGRARAGSFASPLWRGGGVVFGPKPRDFTKKVPKSVRALAFRKAMSERLRAGDIILLDDLKLATHKTKEFIGVLKSLQLDGTALFVAAGEDHNLEIASRNVPDVELTTSDKLNTYQVLKCDKLVFTRSSFEKVEERLNRK